MPPFATEINANNAATENRITPVLPIKCSPADATGVRLHRNCYNGITPVITIVPNT